MFLPVELQNAIDSPRWKSFFEELKFMQMKSCASTCEEEDFIQETVDIESVGSKRMYECA